MSLLWHTSMLNSYKSISVTYQASPYIALGSVQKLLMIDEIKILQQAFPIRWNQRNKNVPRSAPLGCRDLNGKVIILWVLTCGTQDEELIWGETWKIIRWKRIFLPLGCIVFSTYDSGIIFPKSLCLQSSFPCSLKNCMSHEPLSISNPTYVYIIYMYTYISVYIIVMNNNKLNKYIHIYAEICRIYPATV